MKTNKRYPLQPQQQPQANAINSIPNPYFPGNEPNITIKQNRSATCQQRKSMFQENAALDILRRTNVDNTRRVEKKAQQGDKYSSRIMHD